MKNLAVTHVDSDSITFEGGIILTSEHKKSCCENHYLSMNDLTLSDFDDLVFDLSGDDFFRRIEDYGIELIPNYGHSVKIPGYGQNNGYYSMNLNLILKSDSFGIRKYDVTNCQVVIGIRKYDVTNC